MTKVSAFRQIPVYLGKLFRLFMNQKDWRFIAIAAVISFLVCGIVGEDMFTTYESTKSGFFAILSAAIWIGVFNSIQRICKEHSTITSEYRSGLHLSAYVLSHVIFDLCLCLIQTAVLLLICLLYIDFPEKGVLSDHSLPEYFITLFLVIWGSDVMGIMISATASTPNTAMTTMPFVLILQLVMSGVLFKLRGLYQHISVITYSKWGMSALGSIGGLNDPDLPYEMSQLFPQVTRLNSEAAYDATAENLLHAWGCMLLIAVCCILIAFISLKVRNRGS